MHPSKAFKEIFKENCHHLNYEDYFIRGKVFDIREDYLVPLAKEQLSAAQGCLPSHLHYLLQEEEEIVDLLEGTDMNVLAHKGFLFRIPEGDFGNVNEDLLEEEEEDFDEDDNFIPGVGYI